MKKIITVTNNIRLIKVECEIKYIKILYDLLESRREKTTISHSKVPTFKDHKTFVLSKPYRYWFLIEQKNIIVGSVYISKVNTIGIHFFKIGKKILEEVLLFLCKNIAPLKEIPSIRPPNFIINVANKNRAYANIIKKIGGIKIQETYAFDLKF